MALCVASHMPIKGEISWGVCRSVNGDLLWKENCLPMPRMNDNEEFWRDSCELEETMSSSMRKKRGHCV